MSLCYGDIPNRNTRYSTHTHKNKTKTSHYSKATEMNNYGLYKTSGDILQRYTESALSQPRRK